MTLRLSGPHPALLHRPEKEKRAYISAPIILSKLLEPAKRPLAGPSSMERIIGAEIRALFLWSVHSVMLDVVMWYRHSGKCIFL